MQRRRTTALKILQMNMCMPFWKILLFLFVGTAGGVSRLFEPGGIKRSCAGLPDKLDFDHKMTLTSTTNSGERRGSESEDLNYENTGDFWTYRPSEATLALDLSAILYLDDTACLHENQTLSHFRIDLISVNTSKGVVQQLELVISFYPCYN